MNKHHKASPVRLAGLLPVFGGQKTTQLEKLIKLNKYLLSESPQYKSQAARLGVDEKSQFRLFRSLVNIRPPMAAGKDFLNLQDTYLQTAIRDKGITDIKDPAPVSGGIYLWRGDITTFRCDAIVNAANSRMLGCFCPCHGCIDNAIHTFSGVQLCLACAEIMNVQGYEEPTGQAKITPAFNLPSNHIIHTVGPIVGSHLTDEDCEQLTSCYRSCLALADKYGRMSILFDFSMRGTQGKIG